MSSMQELLTKPFGYANFQGAQLPTGSLSSLLGLLSRHHSLSMTAYGLVWRCGWAEGVRGQVGILSQACLAGYFLGI